MAKATDEKELNLEEPEDGSSSESKLIISKKKLIFVGAALTLVLAIGIGAFLFLGGESEQLEEAVVVEQSVLPVGNVEYLELDPPFIISLPDRGRQRFLQANVTIMSRTAGALLTVRRNMPAIRHRLSNVLSAQSIASIQSPGGIEQVRIEATIEINKILVDEFGANAIDEVLFTTFVMQ